MVFDAPGVLLLAPLIGGVVWFAAAWARRVRLSRATRWSPEAARLAQGAGPLGPTGLSVAAFLGVVALAGPRWGQERIQAETRGLNLVFAMDISRSMLAEDAGGASRLSRAVREARRLAQDLAGDRLGLVAFAGASYIMSPLSVDNSALILYLDALDPDVASQGGTALAPAIAMGGELLGAESQLADRVLVVFTDGEAHDSLTAALDAAHQLSAQGVHVILVAEGGRDPARIPLRGEKGALLGYQQEESGRVVQTRRRDDVLSALADAAKGTIVAGELPDQAGAVRDLVSSYKRSRSTETSTQYGRPRAWVPLLGAIGILLAQALVRRTAALVGLILALLLTSTAGARGQAPDRPRTPAERAWDRGDTAAARTWYLAALAAGEKVSDSAWYNAGTAALAAGDFSTAQSALAHASTSLDPEVRFLALYNEGVLALRVAQRDSIHRDSHLGEAERAYREALLLRPHHLGAKWNLELAQRRRRHGGGSGGPPPQGGTGQTGTPPGAPQKGQAPPTPEAGGMTQAQADEILRSIGQEELQTRRERTARMRRATERGVKDW
jgi:Ca-activated chloride channel family protein